MVQGWQGCGSFSEIQTGFSEVGAISLSNPDRWLFVPPLAGLEGQGRGSLGGGGAAGGVSFSLPVLRTHPHGFVFPFFHQGESSGGGPFFSCSEGCDGACSSSFSRLLQPNVHRLEDFRVVETSHRPLCPEPLRQQDPLQDGDHSISSPVHPSGRLDDLHRPEEGVLAGSYPSGQLQVLEVRGLRQALPVSGSPWLPKSSPGLWLRFHPFFTVLVSGSAVTWTTGSFRLTLGRRFSVLWRRFFPSAESWALLSTLRSRTSFVLRGFFILERSSMLFFSRLLLPRNE